MILVLDLAVLQGKYQWHIGATIKIRHNKEIHRLACNIEVVISGKNFHSPFRGNLIERRNHIVEVQSSLEELIFCGARISSVMFRILKLDVLLQR